MSLILAAGCGPPTAVVRSPTPAKKVVVKQLRLSPLDSYRQTVLGLQALRALEELGEGARDAWKRETWDGSGERKVRRLPASSDGWLPSAPCCSLRDRVCPAVSGDLPGSWRALHFAPLMKPRPFQYRYFSAGRGAGSTFVADARGDVGCRGILSWFRVRGRLVVEKRKVDIARPVFAKGGPPQLTVQLDGPEIVRGPDPRKAPLASVEVLTAALTGADELLWAQALTDLQRHGVAAAREVATRLIKSEKVSQRRAATTLFWRWPASTAPPSESQLKLLASLLGDPDPKLRAEMIEQFARRGKKQPELLVFLAPLLSDLDAKLALQAGRAMCTIAGKDGVPHVARALDHRDPGVREGLMRLLAVASRDLPRGDPLAPIAISALAGRLGDTKPKIRRLAVELLSPFGPRAMNHLVQALADTDATVRNNAVYFLASLGRRGQGALPALRAHLKKTKKKFDRELATQAIKKIQGKMPLTAGLSLRSDSTGIPQCDEFLDKYEHCARTGMPPGVRPAMLAAIKKMRQAYKTAASSAGRQVLARSCSQTHRTMARVMKQYNCKW